MFRSKLLILHKLIKTRAHWGYRTAFSQFQPYLYGFRNDIAIINSDKTIICLRRACNVIELIIRSKGHLILVNTNAEYNNIVEHTAKLTGQSFINHKWVGGLLTNWNHIHNVQRHFTQFGADLRAQASNAMSRVSRVKPPLLRNRAVRYSSLERSERLIPAQYDSLALKGRERDGLTNLSVESSARFKKMQKCFAGIRAKKLPDCVIILNANSNYNAICEAKLLKIPIVACVDSNVSNQLQNMITYPIPVNSESVHFIYLLCNCIYKTILYARKSTTALSVK